MKYKCAWGVRFFWQCKIYHWDNSVRLLAMPMHIDLRFIFTVECDFFLIILFSYGLVSGGDRLIRGGGGGWEVLSWQIVFSMSSARKFIFRHFDAKILIFIRDKMWKKKKVDGGGLDWIGGGCIRNVFLKREEGQDFPCNLKYFCKVVKYRYVHVHIVYM